MEAAENVRLEFYSQTLAADFGTDLECMALGSSLLGSGDVFAPEME
jgi:hypothetical protein